MVAIFKIITARYNVNDMNIFFLYMRNQSLGKIEMK